MKSTYQKLTVIAVLCGVFNQSFAYKNAKTLNDQPEARAIAPALIGIKLKSCLGLKTCGYATGVALDDRTILTAAHVVYNYDDKKLYDPSNIRLYEVYYGIDGRKIELTSDEARVFVPDAYKIDRDKNADIAIIKLKPGILSPNQNLRALKVGIVGDSVSWNNIKQTQKFDLYATSWGSTYQEGHQISSFGQIACVPVSEFSDEYKGYLSLERGLWTGYALYPSYTSTSNCKSDNLTRTGQSGDSGSPLYIRYNGRFDLLGVFVLTYEPPKPSDYNQYYAALDQNQHWLKIKQEADKFN